METGNRMSQAARKEYWKRIYPRYVQAEGKEKRGIGEEFCAHGGYHRKQASRRLNGPPPGEKLRRKRRPRKVPYGARVLSILKAVWEAADYPWSVRLKALRPEWLPWIGQHFRLTAEGERPWLAIRARRLDYCLRAHKGRRRRRRRLYGRTQPGTLLQHHIPLKTDPWDVQGPGSTEIDRVAHSGNCATGEFCYSLNLPDIFTGWTQTRAVRGGEKKSAAGMWK
jgi:hypothetical protein